MKKNLIIPLAALMIAAMIGCSSNSLNKPIAENSAEAEVKEVALNKAKPLATEKPTAATLPDEPSPAAKKTEEPAEPEPSPPAEQETTQTPLDGLSNKKASWYFNPNNEHVPPTAQNEIDLKKYNAYYLGDTSEKVIYMTFDQGYENGYTAKILDVLKEKEVPAAFFILNSYLKANKDLVVRMADEGHIVANHSVSHYSMPDLDDDKVISEIEGVAENYKELTGLEMPKFFRPPMGEYSERVLAITSNLGYKTVFWSFAYKDWEVDNQPGRDVALSTVMKRHHNGCIMLLHSVSSSNAEALADMIDSLRAEGYVFKSLYDIEA